MCWLCEPAVHDEKLFMMKEWIDRVEREGVEYPLHTKYLLGWGSGQPAPPVLLLARSIDPRDRSVVLMRGSVHVFTRVTPINVDSVR
jgi:hypothetical protein